MTPRRALTLVEVLVCLLFIGLGAVGVAKLVSHSIRLAERASVRTDLTEIAFAELERLRAEAMDAPGFRPTHARVVPASRCRVTATSRPGSPELGLRLIEVTARSIDVQPPFEVTLTGWVPAGEENRP